MGIVSGGSGGGAAAPLTLTGTSATNAPLTVTGVALDDYPNFQPHGQITVVIPSPGGTGPSIESPAGVPLAYLASDEIAGQGVGHLELVRKAAAGGFPLARVSLSAAGGYYQTGPDSSILADDGTDNLIAVGPAISSSSVFIIGKGVATPPDADLNAGDVGLWLDATNGAAKLMVKAKQANGTVVTPGLSGRDVTTAPAVSAASTLALGTAYQNTLGYDVLLCIYLSVTVNTSGVLRLGVGPTTTPTQQTLVTGSTSTGRWPVPIYLPNSYYALRSVTGTITVAVDGQI